jgi:hypothetical protein
MIVAHVSSTVATIYAEVPPVSTDLMRIGSNRPAIGA